MKKLSFKNFIALSLALVMAFALVFTPVLAEGEESRTLASYFDDFFQEKAMADWLAQAKQPIRQTVDMGLELSPAMVMDAQTAAALNKLGLKVMYQADLLGTGAVSYNLSLYNKADTSKALTLALNIFNDQLLLDLPGILDKPVLMQEEDLSGLASMASPDAAEGSGFLALPQVMAQHGEQAQADYLTAKAHFLEKFEDQGEQTSNFAVGEVNEDLTVHTRFLAADQMLEACRAFVQELRASEAITAIASLIPIDSTELYDFDLDEDEDHDEDEIETDDLEDTEDENYYEDYDFDYGDEAITLNDLLDMAQEDLDEDSLDPMAITWEEYLSADGVKRGNKISLAKPDSDDRICFEGFNVKSSDQLTTGVYFALNASPSVADDDDDQVAEDSAYGLVDLVAFELQDQQDPTSGTSSGSFSVHSSSEGDLLQGSYQDVSILKRAANEELFLGQVNLTVTSVTEEPVFEEVETEDSTEEDPDSYGDIKWVEKEAIMNIAIKGYLEGEDYRLDCTLVPDARLEDQFVTLHLQPRFMAPEEVDLLTDLPADYYDLNNEDDMQALQENEDILTKLMQALAALGLDEDGE